MEVEGGVSCCSPMEEEQRQADVRVKRKTLMAVLQQCQRTLELLSNDSDVIDNDDDDDDDVAREGISESARRDDDGGATGAGDRSSEAQQSDREADELCELIKSRFECPDFLEKLEHAQVSVPQTITEEGNSWDMVNEKDLWEAESVDCEQEDDYVLVKQDDIVDGIACFMAAYLLSLKQTKDLTPNQLQEALSKTFAMKKKKGKLRKAWEGSQVIYNVASWGATAIGLYQNPVIIRVASKAFWTSCQIISKLL